MYEVPDYEEIYGSDPNDAKHFEPKHKTGSKTYVGPLANRWIVVGRLGDSSDSRTLTLTVKDEGYCWFCPLPSANISELDSIATVFTDIREADKAMFAVKELFPELTIWELPFTTKE